MTSKRCETGMAVAAPAERARWVGRYRESGLSLKRFAEEHGLRYPQLHYWIYGDRRRRRTARMEIPKAGPPVFREYLLSRPPAWEWGVEIALPDGTSLRVSRGADPAWVRALLDPLRRPCSH
jgi:hypothetical protein